jgi:hypothetical protein
MFSTSDEEADFEEAHSSPEETQAAPERHVEAAPEVDVQKQKDQMFADANKTAPPKENVDSSLFSDFSVGDVKQIQSTPDHKPPT